MPEDQQAWEQGLSLLQEGKSQEAVDVLWRAASDDPGCFEARLYLGLALGQLQRQEEAARELRAALAINPQSALAQYNLGVVLQTAGRHQEAMAAYDAAVRLDPSYDRAQKAAEDLRGALGPTAVTGPPPVAPAPPPPLPATAAPPAPDKSGRAVVLIIVGVIAAFLLLMALVLGAILFPVFAKAREKARQTSCMSNLRQLALAQIMYAQDNDDVLPAAEGWCDATMPYTRNQQIYVCPSTPELQSGYAMNSDLSGGDTREDIASPPQTVLMYDSTAAATNANDPLTSVPVPGRHNGGNNFAFADGHVKWMSDSASPPGSDEPDIIMQPEEGYEP